MLVLEEHRLESSKARQRFLDHVAKDLSLLGHSLTLSRSANQSYLTYRLRPRPSSSEEAYRKIHENIYARNLQTERRPILEFEANNPTLRFADIGALELRDIHPKLHICTSNDDVELFEYLRRYQRVPSGPGVGAQVRVIIYDEGHNNRPILGILSGCSTRYFQGSRDKHLGWLNPKNDDAYREIRRLGLKRCLQLTVCMALPPYDALCCGRIVAMLAFSKQVLDAYQERYAHPILALTVTGAMRNYGFYTTASMHKDSFQTRTP